MTSGIAPDDKNACTGKGQLAAKAEMKVCHVPLPHMCAFQETDSADTRMHNALLFLNRPARRKPQL